MSYSRELIDSLARERPITIRGLEELIISCTRDGQATANDNVKEYLLHGVGRRLRVIKKAVENIFTIFPPTTTSPLSRDALDNAQINLHAFMMNLYGVFDNWAWVFVHRHGLLEEVGGRHGVGLFKRPTQQHLPQPLRQYLVAEQMRAWHEIYLKSHRDALAHRISPYIPPAEFTEDDARQYNELEAEKYQCIVNRQWDRLENIWAEQSTIGLPCMFFLHVLSADEARPTYIHPQLISDSKTVIEFGNLYLQHWQTLA